MSSERMAVNIETNSSHVRMVSEDFLSDSENNSITAEYLPNSYYKFYNAKHHGNSPETVVKMPSTLAEAHELITQLDTQIYSLMSKVDHDSEIIENNNKYLLMKENEHMHKEKEYIVSYRNFLDKIKSYEELISKLKKSINETHFLHEKLDMNYHEYEYQKNRFNELKEFTKTKVIDMLTGFNTILIKLSTKWTTQELGEIFSSGNFGPTLERFLEDFLATFVETNNTPEQNNAKMTIDSEAQTAVSHDDFINHEHEDNSLKAIYTSYTSESSRYKEPLNDASKIEIISNENTKTSFESYYMDSQTEATFNKKLSSRDKEYFSKSKDDNINNDTKPKDLNFEELDNTQLEILYMDMNEYDENVFVDDYVEMVPVEDLNRDDIISFVDDDSIQFEGLDSIVTFEPKPKKKEIMKPKSCNKNKKTAPKNINTESQVSYQNPANCSKIVDKNSMPSTSSKKTVKKSTTQNKSSNKLKQHVESNDHKINSSPMKVLYETNPNISSYNVSIPYKSSTHQLSSTVSVESQPSNYHTETHNKKSGTGKAVLRNSLHISTLPNTNFTGSKNRFKTSSDQLKRVPSIVPFETLPQKKSISKKFPDNHSQSPHHSTFQPKSSINLKPTIRSSNEINSLPDNSYQFSLNSRRSISMIETTGNEKRLPPPPPKELFQFMSQNFNTNIKFTPVNPGENNQTLPKIIPYTPMTKQNQNDFSYRALKPPRMPRNNYYPQESKFNTIQI